MLTGNAPGIEKYGYLNGTAKFAYDSYWVTLVDDNQVIGEGCDTLLAGAIDEAVYNGAIGLLDDVMASDYLTLWDKNDYRKRLSALMKVHG